MSEADDEKPAARTLRARAEAKLASVPTAANTGRPADEILTELHIHQVELGMQNEALRQAQELLAESRDQYIELFEFAPVGYLTLTFDGMISAINLTGATLLGRDRKKLLHKQFRSFVVAGDKDRWTLHSQACIKRGAPGDAEFALKRGDGAVLRARVDCVPWIPGTGLPSLRVTLTDNSEQRRQTDALVESEARLAGTIESALDAIVTFNDKQQIVVFNPAAEAIFGYTRAEMLGASHDILLPESARGRHFRQVRAFGREPVSSRRMSGARVVTARRRDGSEFPIEASISHVETSHGQQYTIVLRDVSEHMKIAQALARAQEELHDVASLASSAREQERRHIARELHDDLAQSLWALKIELGNARDSAGEIPDQLKAHLQHLESVTESAIDSARRIAGNLRPHVLDNFGLVAAIESLLEEHAHQTKVTPELSIGPLTFAKDEPYATALYRVVQESLTNIAKHAKATAVKLSIHEDTAGLSITIHDNGRGFGAEDRRKQASFGMAGMRERVQLMRGALRVNSALGKGTSIHIRVPPPTS